MQPVIDRVYMITINSFINMYVIVGQDGLAVVDTGMSASTLQTLEHELARHSFGLYAVNHILITHAHMDHVGGLPALQNVINAPTYAHRVEAAIIRGEQKPIYAKPEELDGFNSVIARLMPTGDIPTARVDIDLHGGETLDAVLPGLQVIDLPGHSYGQVGFWWAEKKLLIGGDVLIHLPWGLRMPFRVVSPDWEAVKSSIRKVADLGVETLCLGHGTPIIKGAGEKIRQLADRIGA